MDLTLAATAIAAAAPFLSKLLEKGSEKLGEVLAEEGFKERAAIWDKVKSLFPDNEIITLNLLENKPTSQDFQEAVSQSLAKKLETNPEAEKELRSLLEKVPDINQIKNNVMVQSGNNNIGVQDTTNSTININQK